MSVLSIALIVLAIPLIFSAGFALGAAWKATDAAARPIARPARRRPS